MSSSSVFSSVVTMTSDSKIFFIFSPKSFFAYIINFLLIMSKKFIIYAKKDLGLTIKNIIESEVIVIIYLPQLSMLSFLLLYSLSFSLHVFLNVCKTFSCSLYLYNTPSLFFVASNEQCVNNG